MMTRIAVILFGVIPSVFGRERAYVPEIFPETRYQHIWVRKPFHPPTPQAPAVQAEGLEQQYTLSGLLKIGGEWTAFVQDRKSLKRHCVSGVVNEIGLQLVSVKESSSSEAPAATIRAGQQIGVIRFDPSLTKRADDSLTAITHRESSKPTPTPPPAGYLPTLRSDGEPPSPIQTLRPNLLNSHK